MQQKSPLGKKTLSSLVNLKNEHSSEALLPQAAILT